MADGLFLSLAPPVVGLLGGGVVGACGHAFAVRWPRPRSVGPGWAGLIAAGAIVGLAFALCGPSGRGAVLPAVLVALLLPITVVDLELRLIPDVLTLPGTAVCLALSAFLGQDTLALMGWSCAAAGVFALPAAVSKGSVGWGDVKLAALLGAALGGAVIGALALALALAGVSATAMLAREGRAARRRTIPLAPALTTGALAALLLG